MIDLFSPYPRVRQEAKEWLYRENPDFVQCCKNALLDPDLVMKTFEAMRKVIKKTYD